jgi:ElaB/YqjD/DUF883 family membrane-anchored ribosome-binding protein
METRLSSPVNETHSFPTERLVEDIKLVAQRAGEKAREGAKAADRVVHEYPYRTIGLALGMGLLIGLFARRHWTLPK